MSFKDLANLTLGAVTNCLGGDPVTYTAQGYPAVTINAPYDGIYEEVDPNTGAVIASIKPNIFVRNSDLPVEPKQGDLCSINSVDYKVVNVQPDGQGGSKLILHKA